MCCQSPRIIQISYQKRLFFDWIAFLFQLEDIAVACAYFFDPGMAFVIYVADAGEADNQLASGPNIGVVGRIRHHLDNVGVECLGMDAAIAFHIMFSVAGNAAQSHFRGAKAEDGLQHIAVEAQVDVAAALLDPEDEMTAHSCDDCINTNMCGVDAGSVYFQRDGIGTNCAISSDGIGAAQVANGSVCDLAQTVVINRQVDAVVVAAEPVEIVLVFDDQRVPLHLGGHFLDEVLGTGHLNALTIAIDKFDIHVVVNANCLKALP